MQVDTYCPSRIRDTYTGEVWWYSRRDRRYHQRPDDAGKPASDFFNFNGNLAAYYEEVRQCA